MYSQQTQLPTIAQKDINLLILFINESCFHGNARGALIIFQFASTYTQCSVVLNQFVIIKMILPQIYQWLNAQALVLSYSIFIMFAIHIYVERVV